MKRNENETFKTIRSMFTYYEYDLIYGGICSRSWFSLYNFNDYYTDDKDDHIGFRLCVKYK